MKTIGLIGGLSWESSAEYYRIINQTIKIKLGGLHSAQCLMFSFDFEDIETFQHQGKWDEATGLMVKAAQDLERGGADFLVICSNTMHKMADEIQKSVRIPLLHIADASAKEILSCGMKRIGLLATRFTMEEDFYRSRLHDKHGLDVVVPAKDERRLVHEIIYRELCLGVVKESSRETFRNIIKNLVENGGVQGILLGCTEIGLLIKPSDSSVPLFDTTAIHATAAVEYALSE